MPPVVAPPIPNNWWRGWFRTQRCEEMIARTTQTTH